MFTSRLDSGHALGVFRLAEPNEPSDFNIFQASTIEFVDSRHLFDPALVVILDYEYASLHIAWARELPDLLPRTRRSTVVAVVTASEAARSILQEASWYVRGGWELLAAPHVAGATSEIERRLGRRLPISGALNGREE